MAILYNCHTDNSGWRITKFNDGEVESSYLCTDTTCECPAGQRSTCRHRQMLPLFIARGAVNSFWFLDFERKGWVMNEIGANDIYAEPAELLGFDKEMQKALEADGEKLRQLTGEDHGPVFLTETIEVDSERSELGSNKPELTIKSMIMLPDDANVAEEFGKLLYPEPANKPSWRRI